MQKEHFGLGTMFAGREGGGGQIFSHLKLEIYACFKEQGSQGPIFVQL